MSELGTWILAALLLQAPSSLDSSNPKERLDAVERLSLTGRTENVAPLAEALKKETKSDVRAAIVAGLGRIAVPEVIPILSQSLLTDLDKDVRLQVIDSFQRLYISVDTTGPIRTIFNKVRSVFASSDRPLVHNPAVVNPAVNQALADAMQRDFSQEVRAAAARALGSLGARDKLGLLISTLEAPQNREHIDVRVEIVESLGLLQDAGAGAALERALRDPNRRISQAAILSIGQVGHRAAREALESIFRTDRSDISREKALQSISLMRDPGAQPLFEAQLSSTNDTYREISAEGLARVPADANVLKARYAIETKPSVRNALAFALVAADEDNYFVHLANALDGSTASQAQRYLFELGKYEGKLPQLHLHLRSMSPRVRARMAQVVGNVGDPSSRPLIEELTKDKDSAVVSEAIIALRKLTPA